MPSFDQSGSAIRSVVIFVCGVLASFGFVPPTDLQSLQQALGDIGEGTRLLVRGSVILIPFAMGAWGVIEASLKRKAARVAAAPLVRGILTQATAEGRALAEAIPIATVVPAGTSMALRLAKAA